MLQHPLLPLAICYVAGVVVAGQVRVPLVPALLAAFGAGGLALCCPRTRGWSLGLLMGLAGLVNLAARTAVLSPYDLRLVAGGEPSLTTLRGRLAATPVLKVQGQGEEQSARTLAVIEAEALGGEGAWEPVRGRVAVMTPAVLTEEFFGGRRVEVFGVLRVPRPPRAPGLFDARRYFRWLGIYHQLEAGGTNDWRLASDGGQPSEPPWGDRFVRWAQRTLARGLPGEDEPLRLVWAMTLGWRTALTGEVAAPFMQSGTMHVFAISGLHVMLIAQVAVAVLRGCRVPRRWTVLLVAPGLWFYAGATGWQASAVRATVMMTVVMGGWVLARPGNLLNSLAGAGVVLLLWEPRQLFQAGFQLSFVVVLGMGLLLPSFERWRDQWLRGDPLLPPELWPAWRRRLHPRLRDLMTSFGVSLAAWIGSLPLIAEYFHLVTPVSLLANMVVVPLSGGVLASSLASLACAPWLPGASELFNHSGWFWMWLMIEVSEWCAELPGAFVRVPAPGPLCLLLGYGVLVAVAGGWFREARWCWAARGLVLALTCVLVGRWVGGYRSSQLVVLPMSSGYAVWVDASGGGEDLLLDCGNAAGVQQVVIPFLHAQGRDRIPNLALTHGDARHVGGAPCLETNLPPDRLWTSAVRFRSPGYRRYVEAVSREGRRHQQVRVGERLAGWEVLHPDAGETYRLADEGTLVLRRELSGIRILLLSDLGLEGQGVLLNRRRELQADVVVAGLPTRGQALSAELIEAIQPRLIIVADGERPGPGSTVTELRRRLLALGVPTVFTSEEGAITVRFAGGRGRMECGSGRVWEAPADGKPLATPPDAL